MADNRDDFEVMTLSNLKIRWIMRWGNFDGTCAKLHINRFIGDDRDFAADDRHLDVHADEVFITFIVWMDGDRCISEQCFRSGRRNDDLPYPLEDRIGDRPQ